MLPAVILLLETVAEGLAYTREALAALRVIKGVDNALQTLDALTETKLRNRSPIEGEDAYLYILADEFLTDSLKLMGYEYTDPVQKNEVISQALYRLWTTPHLNDVKSVVSTFAYVLGQTAQETYPYFGQDLQRILFVLPTRTQPSNPVYDFIKRNGSRLDFTVTQIFETLGMKSGEWDHVANFQSAIPAFNTWIDSMKTDGSIKILKSASFTGIVLSGALSVRSNVSRDIPFVDGTASIGLDTSLLLMSAPRNIDPFPVITTHGITSAHAAMMTERYMLMKGFVKIDKNGYAAIQDTELSSDTKDGIPGFIKSAATKQTEKSLGRASRKLSALSRLLRIKSR